MRYEICISKLKSLHCGIYIQLNRHTYKLEFSFPFQSFFFLVSLFKIIISSTLSDEGFQEEEPTLLQGEPNEGSNPGPQSKVPGGHEILVPSSPQSLVPGGSHSKVPGGSHSKVPRHSKLPDSCVPISKHRSKNFDQSLCFPYLGKTQVNPIVSPEEEITDGLRLKRSYCNKIQQLRPQVHRSYSLGTRLDFQSSTATGFILSKIKYDTLCKLITGSEGLFLLY